MTAAVLTAELMSTSVGAAPSNLVFSQLYAGGGIAGGVWHEDYIELLNVSTNDYVLPNAYTIQYGAPTGPFGGTGGTNFALIPAGTLIGGRKYLFVQTTQSGTTGASFPISPNLYSTAPNMGTVGGKLMLVNTTTIIQSYTTSDSRVLDMVGYGTANTWDGTTVAPAVNHEGLYRANGGLTDTDQNGSDFSRAAPMPRNHTSGSAEVGDWALY